MAMFRKAPDAPLLVSEPLPRRSLMASAARFTFGGKQAWQGVLPAGDRRWQVEAWRHYDQCGELRYATGWKGNACAQAVLFAADIDPDTGKPIGPTDNQTVRDIAGGILGGPTKRPQMIRTIVINLEMTGEVYVVVIPQPSKRGKAQPDRWIVVSGTEMSQQGSVMKYTDPDTGKPVEVGEKDTLIRIWNPHPRLQLAADSAVRALLPVLREIEKSSQNIAARLDSRLASAGVMTVPSEADLAGNGDADSEDTYSLAEQIQRHMQASLAEPGSAAAQVPIIFEVPAEFADAFNILQLESPLSKEIITLRDSALGRLAVGMDLPREVVEGMGDSTHWNAALVADSTYRTHLVPVLDTISDAFTTAYLHPIAVAAGIPEDQVDRYALQFDATALVGEPDPIPQALELYDRGLITAEAVLKIAGIPEDYAPSGEEKMRSLAERLVTGAPTLFQQPALQRILGFTVEAPPAADTPALTASSVQSGVVVSAASLAVVYALERAGNRLLPTQRLKDEYADVPRHEVHVKLRPDDRHGDLLAGAWRHVPELAQRWDLDGYTRGLLATGLPHSMPALAEWMASRG